MTAANKLISYLIFKRNSAWQSGTENIFEKIGSRDRGRRYSEQSRRLGALCRRPRKPFLPTIHFLHTSVLNPFK